MSLNSVNANSLPSAEALPEPRPLVRAPSRSHSQEPLKEGSIDGGGDESTKSSALGAIQSIPAACDNLSQVSEESAFEEDDQVRVPAAQVDPSRTLKKGGDLPAADDKKRKQVSINKIILASMPNNAREQEEIFFASGFTSNPVFEYENPLVASRFISQFKKPRSDLMAIATKIMDAFLAEYGSETNYLLTEGRVITDRDETEEIFKRYLIDHNILDVSHINFSDKIVAPTSVTYDNFSPKIRINIQLPIEYREGRITGVLHHEIGTHFLRRYNEVL